MSEPNDEEQDLVEAEVVEDENDDETSKAWVSDEERATKAPPPAPATPATAGGSWSEAVEASAKADAPAPPPTRASKRRTVMVALMEHALQEGETCFTRMIDTDLTQEEMRERSRALASVRREKRALEEALKAHVKTQKGKISEKDQEETRVIGALEIGKEARDVECIEMRDDRRGEMVTCRCDTGARLDARPMSFAERQVPLPGTEPGETKPGTPAGKKKKAKKRNAAATAGAGAE